MQYAFLIYETPEAFAHRTTGAGDAYIGAWRAYYQACVKAGIYVGGDPLHLPETGTTVRQTDALSREWEERFLSLRSPNELLIS